MISSESALAGVLAGGVIGLGYPDHMHLIFINQIMDERQRRKEREK